MDRMVEEAASITRRVHKQTCRKNSSFSLRCPSLNSLRLRRIFDIFDKNGDGTITIQDLSQALSVLGLDADFSELESTIRSHIKPGNMGLQFEDFLSLHQSLDNAFFRSGGDGGEEQERTSAEDGEAEAAMQEEHDLSEAFKVFDEDGDGYISAEELQVVLQKLGLPEAKEMNRIRDMIRSVDCNHDGLVDFFEFKHMMRRSVLVRSS